MKWPAWDRAHADITDAAAVERSLAHFDAQAVFNCAAYNQVDVAEKEPQAAYQVNALAVRNLALACRQIDARLVHFSTDYVFDGTASRPYVEEDPTHPLGAYAVSKLGGRTVRAGVSGPRADRPHLGRFRPRRLGDRARQFRGIDAATGWLGPADPRGGRSRRIAHLCAVFGRSRPSIWWRETPAASITQAAARLSRGSISRG